MKDPEAAGTLEEWKRLVALACDVKENYYWALGVMMGFAGCIVDLCGMEFVRFEFDRSDFDREDNRAPVHGERDRQSSTGAVRVAHR